MVAPVSVRKIESKRDFKAFFEFPWTVYKNDPNWVPTLLSMRRSLLDKNKNAAWDYMEGEYFAAWRGDQIVGTITAFINHRHNEFHHENIGWFGTFEVFDDEEAASALLDTALQWVGERGYEAMRGPASFTTHEEIGLLVSNFSRPVLLMPYNPPYYQRLIENAGFEKVMDLNSFYLNREGALNSGLFTRLEKLTNGIMKRSNITVRQADPKNLKADFAMFKDLYNAAWEKNWGFVPMTERELEATVQSLGQFFDPKLAHFAFVDGNPAGFVLPIPDFNQVLHRAYPRPGVPEWWTLLKALYYWKINPIIDWVRTPLFGVKEEYRNKGVDAVLLYYGLKAILAGRYRHSDSGWILEVNDKVIRVLKSMGTECYKTHRLYQKATPASAVPNDVKAPSTTA
ncbi:MAG: GNAT family N-acetyltransferase [Chloroflexota bacterium]